MTEPPNAVYWGFFITKHMNTHEAQVVVYHHLIDKYWNGTTPATEKGLCALNFLTTLSLDNADKILQKQNEQYKNYIQTTINYGNPF